MTNATGFVFPPYLVYRVSESGHPWSESDVRATWRENPHLPGGVKMGDPILDTQLNAFIAEGKAEVQIDAQRVIPVCAMLAVFPTRAGAVRVFAFAERKYIETRPNFFRQLLAGVRIDARNKVGWNQPRTGLFISLGAIVVMILVLWRAKPANSSRTPLSSSQ